MGKTRRGRPRPHRADPVSRPAKPPSDPELAQLREKRVLPVIKDLQSSEPKSRTAAAAAVANIIQDAKCRKLLLREQIVHIVLTETLTDSSVESRAAGWEILKVLAQEEESDFCVHLYRVDALTALEHAAKTITELLTATDPPFAKTPKAQQRYVLDISASLCSLINYLALARDEILEAIVSKATLTRLLFHLIAAPTVPSQVANDALLTLMTLSEDNNDLAQAIVHDQSVSCYDKLSKFSQGTDFRAVLACGVLHNVFSTLEWCDHSRGLDGACDAILVPRICEILKEHDDVGAVVNGQDGPGAAEIMQTALEVLASIATDMQGALERGNKSKATRHTAPGEDVAMEVDNNGNDDEEIAQGSDDDDEDDELEDAGGQNEQDDDDDDIGDIEEDMEMVTGPDDEVAEMAHGLADLPTLNALLRNAIPQLFRIAGRTVDNDAEIAVQSHALAALNNLAWTISCIDFTGGANASLYNAWVPSARGIWGKVIGPILESDTADISLAALVTSLAWAVSRVLRGSTPLYGDQHRRFITLYQASRDLSGQEPDDPFQGLGVKCIGVLGQLALDPAPVPLNREIGTFLMTVLAGLPGTSPADAVEALNQVFDIYGDEELPCDKEVFCKDGFLAHLEATVPKVRSMVKSIDKRAATELRSRADEAALNLGRFIQYKRKHMS